MVVVVEDDCERIDRHVFEWTLVLYWIRFVFVLVSTDVHL